MIILLSLLYAAVFSVLTNCFLLFEETPAVVACIIAFVVLNLCCGLVVAGCKSRRLRFLSHGVILLTSFCLSLVTAVVLFTLSVLKILPTDPIDRGVGFIYALGCLFILFWNGMICVYLTSVQLGIKIRVIGVVCGMIPVANLVVLGIILSKAYAEVRFERKKERVNRERKPKKICETRYPILLVHGVFFRDNRLLNYWGRIPHELEANGAVCYYGQHQSAASVRDSGEELAERIRAIVRETGCGKVNIIAHSKGGLDCRYAIAHGGVADLVASLTTINTPHRGCLFAEWLLDKAPAGLKERVAATYNHGARWLGDTQPDF